MLLAVPLGLGAAVYVSEFCEGKRKESLKIIIELLAAIPSVVWGFIVVVIAGIVGTAWYMWYSGRKEKAAEPKPE